MRDDRWKERPRCPGFLLPFGHRHWLVGPSRSRRGARPSLRSAYRAVPGPRRGCHVPHGRDPTGEGALCTPGRRCSHDRLLVTGRRCRSPAASPAPSTTSHLRGFRCRGINESSLALTRPVFSLPVAPGWSGNPWAYPLVLRTPPLPATHARGGDGSRTLFRSSLLPTSSTLQSASPLKPCDLVSQPRIRSPHLCGKPSSLLPKGANPSERGPLPTSSRAAAACAWVPLTKTTR
jgi:hypothetical protein